MTQDLEIRKLQKIKGGSYTLSIPKKWVDRKKLKSGQQIAVYEEDGALVISPVATSSEKPARATLSFKDLPDIRTLQYKIATYYIQGISQIDVVSRDIIPAEQKRKLKLLRLALPGVEVSEEGANRISFQVLIDPKAFQLEHLLKKTSEFSLKLQDDAVRSMASWDFPLAREVIERSGEALRHYRLTIRQVALSSMNKAVAKDIGVRNCQECVTFALMARDLSRLVYHCSQIARHVLSLEVEREVSRRILNSVEDLSRLVYDMQKDAVQSYLKKDTELAIRVFCKMDKVREKEKQLSRETLRAIKDVDVAVTLGLIGRELRRMAGYSVAIADDSMNRALSPTSSRPVASKNSIQTST